MRIELAYLFLGLGGILLILIIPLCWYLVGENKDETKNRI